MAAERLARASFGYVLATIGNALLLGFVAVLAAALASSGSRWPLIVLLLAALAIAVVLPARLLASGATIDGTFLRVRTVMRSQAIEPDRVTRVTFRDVWFTPAAAADVPTLVLTSGRKVKLTFVLGAHDQIWSLAERLGEWAGTPVEGSVGRSRRQARRAARER